jgi:hypothetical protein
MKRNKVRLTERELISLIKRTVKENQQMRHSELGEGFLGNSMDWIKTAVEKAKDLFNNEYKEDTLAKAQEAGVNLEQEATKVMNKSEAEPEELAENLSRFARSRRGKQILQEAEKAEIILSEALINEGLINRGVARILGKLGTWVGIGITGTGILGFAANAMGYTDSSFLIKVNEMIQSLGCANFCGPIATAVAVLGLIMALVGAATAFKNRPPSDNVTRY